MELTRSLVETRAQRYQEVQPLATVEREHVEILPEMLAEEEFGWRDVEWVVQWYFIVIVVTCYRLSAAIQTFQATKSPPT